MPDSLAGRTWLRRARRVLNTLATLEKLFCVAAFALLVAVLFADVVSRETTAAGLHWASQMGVWANVVVVMAGFGLASQGGAHLRPRFMDSWLPARWNARLATLQYLCMALFCAAAGWVALAVVMDSYRLGTVEINLFLPIWPVQSMLPVAFFAGALRYFCYTIFVELRPPETGAFDARDAGNVTDVKQFEEAV